MKTVRPCKQLARMALATMLLAASAVFAQAPAPPADDTAPSRQAQDDDAAIRAELQKLSAEFRSLRTEHASACAGRPDDLALAMLKVEKCALLVGRYFAGPERDARFEKIAAEAREAIAALASDKPCAFPATGLVERAYLSDVDASAQPYYVYVPAKLDPAKPAPMLLFLHGWVPTIDKVNWLETTMPESATRCADRLGAVLLVPFARSNTDFLGIGERDVLHAIERVKRDYRVDADRVWLAGCSMGASGVWAVAAHYPQVFAAAVPSAGRTDYNLWQNVPRGTLAPFKQLLVDRDYASTLACNFRSLPVFAFHGEDDLLVQPEQSRAMVKMLQSMGFEALLHVFPRGDHWTCFDAYESDLLAGWLPSKRRCERPLRVTYRTYHPRLNRAWWAIIDDFVEYGKPAEIDATVLSPELVSVKAENVARFTLDLATPFFRTDRVKALLSDGRTIAPVRNDAGRLTFQLAMVPTDGLRKRGELCGPVYEAYQQPFMLVFGSAGGPEAEARSRRAVARAVVEWFDFAAGTPRVKKDTEVSAEDIKRYNLVLFGTPADHDLLRRIADKLPVTIGEGKFTVGERTFAGDNLGLAMVYPNPLNPQRLVVVWSGAAWGAGLPKNHKLDLLPDYIVFDDTVGPVSGTNNFKVAGFFDMNWKLDPKLMWFGPEKAPPAPETVTPGTPLP